jgi:hypothetical protein
MLLGQKAKRCGVAGVDEILGDKGLSTPTTGSDGRSNVSAWSRISPSTRAGLKNSLRSSVKPDPVRSTDQGVEKGNK